MLKILENGLTDLIGVSLYVYFMFYIISTYLVFLICGCISVIYSLPICIMCYYFFNGICLLIKTKRKKKTTRM